MRRLSLILVVALLVASYDSSAADGMTVQKNVMVRMRDGVRLATDIYRPIGSERYPVVLTRTPYGSETKEYLDKAKYYAAKGYVLAVQDVRGKYDSDGDWYGKRNEGEDGSDTITWLGTQPWSTGKVGMIGGSYVGAIQYLVADQQNPYLKALVPMVAPNTLGRDLADYQRLAGYSGGETYSVNGMWLIMTDGRVNQSDPESGTFDDAWGHLPRSDYPKIFGREMAWLPFAMNHRHGFWEEYLLRAAEGNWSGPISDDWWKNYEARYRRVQVPILHVSGWYDCWAEQMIKNFQFIRKYAQEPLARDHQYLVIGPWQHRLGRSLKGLDYDFGPDAKINTDEVSARFFDRWLKGEDNGVDRQKPVRVFVMGENRWREADDWPIPGTRFTKYFLHSSGDAHLAQSGGGQLSTRKPGREPVDHYTYDPANPVLLPTLSVGQPTDLSEVQKRPDVLVYTTEALKGPVEITGPLNVVLYVSTSAPSTDLLVRVLDVHPDGKAYSVFNPGSPPYRTHFSKDVETTADGTRIVKADMLLYPMSNLFRAGHRVRVEISSSFMVDARNFGLPIYGSRGLNVEPGTELTATRWNLAKQTIHHDKTHPSHIVLPIVPR